ncbi:peptidylprolyl isomerase [Ohtaekwangia sp.]|uniref:peptidylprolyl isomerase n=1 Tax=Ohtaekwangia sp. TaxID=2066019 RepID=UPI002FDD1001
MIKTLCVGIPLFLIFVTSCTKPEQPLNKFSDTVLVKIADFQDRRKADSLYKYFKSENALYRREAVLAFASVQDTAFADELGYILLNDANTAVRQAAAYALGQTGTPACAAALTMAIDREKDSVVVKEILEAYGKATPKWSLQVTPENSFGWEGLAWSYYRAALKGRIDSTYSKQASELLQKGHTEPTRLAAANYFARGTKGFDAYEAILIQAARYDLSSDVRMAAAWALKKIKTDSSRVTLERLVKSDADYRIRVNAVRGLQSFPFNKTKETLKYALNDKQINVAVTASEVIDEVLTPESASEFRSLVKTISNHRLQGNIYKAILRVSPVKEVIAEIESKVKSTDNPYAKAAFITALQSSVGGADFVHQQLLQADTPVVKSAAASALVAMNHHKDFKPTFRKHFSELYVQAIQTGDAAVIGIVAAALADSTLGYKSVIKDFSFLYEAKKKLSLPKDIEALQPLEAAIAYVEGRKVSAPVKNEFNHPIDWKLVKSIPKDQRAIIKTSKGDITLRLLVEDAPGSVANFVALAKAHYFNKKFFHRVVPNFVIQAGCNRGDGGGSEDYSIRSEFSPVRYRTGSVGMASAGKDTEGTQWFITHSPTPHLDGRYTIFAEVESGMDIVHIIEVGDLILDVQLPDSRNL